MELITVCRANSINAGFAKQILEDQGIECLVRNLELQHIIGIGSIGAGFNPITGPVEILVRKEDAARASELLEDFPVLDG